MRKPLAVVFGLIGVAGVAASFVIGPLGSTTALIIGVSMLGTGVIMYVVSSTVGRLSGQDADARRIAQTGHLATATIVAMRDTGTMVNYDPVVDFELDVAGPTGNYRVMKRHLVSKLMLGRLMPGAQVAIKVDVADPSRIVFA